MENIKGLPTEQRNPYTLNIDEVPTRTVVGMINEEDKRVAFCVERHLDEIAAAVDAVAEKYGAGGRIVYCGAGTSGRMGYMDSAECPPTFGVSPDSVVALLAGGVDARAKAKEGAEDSPELCVEDMKAIGFSAKDVLVGIAASGRTPYVIGGMEYAKSLGAVTVSITCNEDPDGPINSLADFPIGIYAGPEAITGSTRMKAGTVQKMVLNMLSTAVMVKTGKVYSNLMINVATSNEKLVDRAMRIVGEVTGSDIEAIRPIMQQTCNNVALTSLVLLTGQPLEKCREVLESQNGHIKNSLKILK